MQKEGTGLVTELAIGAERWRSSPTFVDAVHRNPERYECGDRITVTYYLAVFVGSPRLLGQESLGGSLMPHSHNVPRRADEHVPASALH